MSQQPAATSPNSFRNPHGTWNKVARVLWWWVWVLLFRPTPWFMGAWRTWLLKLFGADIGFARFHRSVEIWAPWLLKTGRDCYIDKNVVLYNPYGIELGDRVIISRDTILCTPSHDYRRPDLPLIGRRITVGNDVWITARVFVGPGVTIGDGAVVGACAVVNGDVEPWTVVAGNPAVFIKKREILQAGPPAGAAGPSRAAPPASIEMHKV